MEDLFSSLIKMLPAVLALVTPIVVEFVKSMAGKIAVAIPKPIMPILAAAVGAIAEVLFTGSITMAGPVAGMAGTGVRDVIHNTLN